MTDDHGTPGSPENPQRESSDFGQQIRKSLRSGLLVTGVPKWTAYAVIAWQARLSIEVMTGKRGIASLLERFGREASYWEMVCWAAAILGILLGIYSRRLLRRHLAQDVLRLDAIERRLGLADGSHGSMNTAGSSPVEKD